MVCYIDGSLILQKKCLKQINSPSKEFSFFKIRVLGKVLLKRAGYIDVIYILFWSEIQGGFAFFGP